MKARLLIAALLPFLVASCYDPDSNDGKPPAKTTDLTNKVYRIHDDELHVTCWVYRGQSVDCIPDAKLVPPVPVSKSPVDGGWPQDGEPRHVMGGPGA